MTRLTRIIAGCLLLPGALAGPVFGQTDALPNLGDTSGQIYSPQQDAALGAAFMRQLRQSDLVLEDPEATSYIRALGHKLTLHSESPGFTFNFFLVNDSAINAFAGPGGHIGANVGLFTAAESESELAGVLAHEIAHVTQRHLARTFESASKLSLPTTAAILAAILIGTQDGSAGAAALTAASAANLQHQINFTRANEQEADRVGIQTLAGAGFNPFGMSRFFERLQKNSRLYGTRPPEFLSTHPVTTDRIAEAVTRAESYPAAHPDNDLRFRLLRAKLRVGTYLNPTQVLADFQRYHGRDGGDIPEERYELALLLGSNEQYPQAVTIMERLHKQDPDRLAYRLALAELLQKSGQLSLAEQLYRDSLALYPGELAIVLPYAATLMTGKEVNRAYGLLLEAASSYPEEPAVFKQLAQAAGLSGQEAQTHMAMANYFYLNGYTKKAVEQIRLAGDVSGLSDYQAAKIQAQRTRLEKQIKEDELE